MIRLCLFLTLIFSLSLTANAADPESLITHGPRDRPQVALTFDLCQTPGHETILDRSLVAILQHGKIPATFFISGDWMRTHPDEMRELALVPFFEFANHSWSHPDLRRKSRSEIISQVSRTNAELFRHTGRSSNFFRLPFGTFDARTLSALSVLSQHVIQWDVISGDPDPRITAEKMVASIKRQIRNGSIIVMHANGRGYNTAAALPEILSFLLDRGLQPVTISTLLGNPQPKQPEKNAITSWMPPQPLISDKHTLFKPPHKLQRATH